MVPMVGIAEIADVRKGYLRPARGLQDACVNPVRVTTSAAETVDASGDLAPARGPAGHPCDSLALMALMALMALIAPMVSIAEIADVRKGYLRPARGSAGTQAATRLE